MSEKEVRKFSSELENAENTARIRLFGKAAKKYEKLLEKAQSLQPDMVWEMRFMSLLYSVNDDIASRRDPHQTGSLQRLLNISSSMPEETLTMALPGGGFGEYPTTRIFTELSATQFLQQGVFSRNAQTVRSAIDPFLQLAEEYLFFSNYLEPLKRRITGNRAALECEARAQLIEGERLADPEPSAAVAHYMIAVRALRAARLYDEEVTFRKVLTGLRTIRTCWFCGRRVQGAEHLVWLESSISPYFNILLEKNKEDLRILRGDHLVSCKPCFGAINKEADRIAKIYHSQLMAQIQALSRRIASLEARV